MFVRRVSSLRRFSGSAEAHLPPKRRVIFSGIQPSGALHIGNYLGALSHWAALQKERKEFHQKNKAQFHEVQDTRRELLFSIVDMHALTAVNEDKFRTIREDTLEMAVAILACGIDPKASTLFVQSHVKMHAELMWILGCTVNMARLGHMTQFKDKKESRESVPLGLFTYPVLQAADILLYRGSLVPVGEDQVQHIELARDIAASFNSRVNYDFFPKPQAILTKNMRVMSLKDGKAKMSKSNADVNSRISLFDSPDLIHRKIRAAKTDSFPSLSICVEGEERPEVANLLGIYAAFKNVEVAEVEAEFANSGTAHFKTALSELIVERLRPIQKEAERIAKDRGYVEAVLKEGADRARDMAGFNIEEAKGLLGMLLESDVEAAIAQRKQ